MKVLFSPIGGTDPISNYRDGAMLHICRHYLPDKVYLYLSREMCVLHDRNNPYVYCLEELGKLLDHHFECVIIRRDSMDEVQVFDSFVDEFRQILEKIEAEEQAEELLVNVSSGTPAMKSSLLLLSVLSDGKIVPIQVDTPEKAMNPRVEDKKTYDPVENWEVNEDNTPGTENRSHIAISKNWAMEIKKEIIRKQINAFNYVGALQVAKDTAGISTDLVHAIQGAISRYEMDDEKVRVYWKAFPFSYRVKGLDDDKQKIVEYTLGVQVRLMRKEYADFLRALTPLLFDLYKIILEEGCNFSMLSFADKDGGRFKINPGKIKSNPVISGIWAIAYKGNIQSGAVSNHNLSTLVIGMTDDPVLREKVEYLQKVETNLRNIAAHQMTGVTKEWMKEKLSTSPEEIFLAIRYIMDRFVLEGKTGIWNSYMDMNKKLCDLC